MGALFFSQEAMAQQMQVPQIRHLLAMTWDNYGIALTRECRQLSLCLVALVMAPATTTCSNLLCDGRKRRVCKSNRSSGEINGFALSSTG
jgi:hypothetical protein